MEDVKGEKEMDKGQEENVGKPQMAESHLVYELKQRRVYLLRQLCLIQQAIDAVNLTTNKF